MNRPPNISLRMKGTRAFRHGVASPVAGNLVALLEQTNREGAPGVPG